MARARGAKIAFVSVGAGPISSSLSKLLFRWSLSLASYRSFRDEGSRKLIESLGVSRKIRYSRISFTAWSHRGPYPAAARL